MRRSSRRHWLGGALAGACAAAAAAAAAAATTFGDVRGAALGVGASLNGAVPFPADNAWNTDVSGLPVDPKSSQIIASMGASKGLHPDFGAGTWEGARLGIPYIVVSNKTGMVKIKVTAYADESDAGPYPVPPSAPIEGSTPSGKAPKSGDRHVLVVQRDTNRLYELYAARKKSRSVWLCDSAAVFHLDSNNVRPTAQAGWTSADAAGLPILPGLVRFDEVQAGAINHALRVTVSRSRKAYVPPATHWAASETLDSLPPMGMRLRLKASYSIPSGFSEPTKVILRALKKFGMIVADNGSD